MGWGTRGTAVGTAAGGPTVGQHHLRGASWQGERQPRGEWGWHGAVAQLAWHGVTRHGGTVTRCDVATMYSLPCSMQSMGGQQLAHVCTLVQPPHAHFCPTCVPNVTHRAAPPRPRAGLGVLLIPTSVFGIFGFSQGWGETKVPRGSVGP